MDLVPTVHEMIGFSDGYKWSWKCIYNWMMERWVYMRESVNGKTKKGYQEDGILMFQMNIMVLSITMMVKTHWKNILNC